MKRLLEEKRAREEEQRLKEEEQDRRAREMERELEEARTLVLALGMQVNEVLLLNDPDQRDSERHILSGVRDGLDMLAPQLARMAAGQRRAPAQAQAREGGAQGRAEKISAGVDHEQERLNECQRCLDKCEQEKRGPVA